MELSEYLDRVRKLNPLVHHITNYVTVNDCANACLAVGASPVMADAIDEKVAASAQPGMNMHNLEKQVTKEEGASE